MNDQTKRLLQRLGLWAGAAAAVVAALYGLMRLGSQSPAPGAVGGPVAPLSSADHVKGSSTAPVVLIEYSDFQCPACSSMYPLIKQLSREFGDRLAVAYRHFPLQQHEHAPEAAYAAEAAGQQGKFWEFHDKLFETQRQWSGSKNAPDVFEGYARELGLDVEKFNTDRKAAAIEERVKSDQRSGMEAGVDRTPTLFLGGAKITPSNYEELRQLVEQALPGKTP